MHLTALDLHLTVLDLHLTAPYLHSTTHSLHLHLTARALAHNLHFTDVRMATLDCNALDVHLTHMPQTALVLDCTCT